MSVIVGGARTAIGRLLGSLKDMSASDLGAVAIQGALAKTGVKPSSIDYVIMGHVLQAGAGQNSARQASVKAGLPMSVPALTVNKVCLSGINAISLADQMIRSGAAEVVVAGGMESMSQAPHLLVGSREGVKYGDWQLKDSMTLDGLYCAIDQLAMGESTEKYNANYKLTRQSQDEFAVRSHELAQEAINTNKFADEIEPKTSSLVRGEELLELLNLIIRFLVGHAHPYPGLPPIPQSVDGVRVDDLLKELLDAQDKLLNKNIRIN